MIYSWRTIRPPLIITFTTFIYLLLGYFSNQSTRAQSEIISYRAILDTLQGSRFSDLAYDPEYGLLIGDTRELTVWQIIPNGQVNHLHAPGQGPGEYLQVTSITWGPKGEVYLLDRSNSRVVKYSNTLNYESYWRENRAIDIAITENGRIYIATTFVGDGPVIRIDPISNMRQAVTTWRDSDEIMGISDIREASKAILQWDSSHDILYVGYMADARFEVISDDKIIRTFVLPSKSVDKNISEMKRYNRTSGKVSFYETLLSFCLTHNGCIVAAIGDEIILTSPNGTILRRGARPTQFRQFYSGPNGNLLAVNQETMKIELIPISELFTLVKQNIP